MLKINMKAITLVLMLFIGMMSSTGFGNTTADLTDNSTTLTPMDSHVAVSATVASVSVFNAEIIKVLPDSNYKDVLKNDHSTNEDFILKSKTLAATTINPDTIEGDVGWRNQFENYKNLPKKSIGFLKHTREGPTTMPDLLS